MSMSEEEPSAYIFEYRSEVSGADWQELVHLSDPREKYEGRETCEVRNVRPLYERE